MKILIGIVGMVVWSFLCSNQAEAASSRVCLKTSEGTIVLELNPQAAPETVKNFLSYVSDGFYDGTIFHRVIKGFMIQGGGLTESMEKKSTKAPIKNEADNGLKNVRGTIAMARTGEPHSATSQFFINTVDNSYLDYRNASAQGWGYCVFGRVVEGMEVLDTIEALPTTFRAGHNDVPETPVIIERASIEDAGGEE